MNSVQAAKADLRRRLRGARRALSAGHQQRAASILSQRILASWPQRAILAYVAVASELSTAVLLQQCWLRGDAPWLPRVNGPGHALEWWRVPGEDCLQAGYRGIQEPQPGRCRPGLPEEPAIALIPGLGFTADGRRLGQGGGYYDASLAYLRNHGIHCLGVCHGCQLCPDIPCEDHDQRVDEVMVINV